MENLNIKRFFNTIDKKTIYAIIIVIFFEICLECFLPYARENITWIKNLYEFRKLILSILLIGPVVFFIEKNSFSSLGFTTCNWKKTLLTIVISSISALLVVYFTAVIWKHLGQLQVEGDMIYFIGNRIPYTQITPAILYILFLDQILSVALPEEFIYRGYLQSRLNFTWNPVISILGSTIVFALVHIDRPLMLFHLMFMGPILGYAFYYSKSIYPGVFAHYLSNIGGILIIKYVALH